MSNKHIKVEVRAYKSVKLKRTELLPPSRLYPLEPLGVGTPDVESSTGYFSRLAAAHCVYPGALFAAEVAPRINREYLSTHEGMPRSGAVERLKTNNYLNGIGRFASDWINALESLTLRTDLHLLTMLPWRNTLSWQSLFRRVRAWCPVCYEAQRRMITPPYEKLIWSLTCITVCQQHQRILETLCPFCKRHSLPLSTRSRPGYCSLCEKWLGATGSDERAESCEQVEKIEAQTCVAVLVGEALSFARSIMPSFTKESLDKSLRSYADKIFRGNKAALARFLDVKIEVLGSPKLSLAVFVRIIQKLDTSVADLLRGTVSNIPTTTTNLGRVIRKDELREILLTALVDPACPSITEVAMKCGCSIFPLYVNFSDLCKQITARHRKTHPNWFKRTYHYDETKMRQVMEAALVEEPPPSAAAVAERLGYKMAYHLARKCPEIYSQIVERRKGFFADKVVQIKQKLLEAIDEEPPLSLNEFCRRNGNISAKVLQKRFPKLTKKLCSRNLESGRAARQRVKLELEKALSEYPPPSVKEVARRLNHFSPTLYKYFHDLCCSLAKLHREHLQQVT